MNKNEQSIDNLTDEVCDFAKHVYDFTVAPEENGTRLDVFLSDKITSHSRNFFQNCIKDGLVQVDQTLAGKSNLKLKVDQKVRFQMPAPKETEILPQDIPLDILYEDADLMIINKPKGMVVHPANGHADGTLVNAIMFYAGDSLSGINGEKRPGIVHRIDKNTTGSLIVCKNDIAHNGIAIQLKEHSIKRIYKGIVHGNIKEDFGTVDAPLGRDPKNRKRNAIRPDGRHAVTHYKVLERFDGYTYAEFELETGRTHQIRVHMASIGHPLLGDDVYGPKKCPFTLEGQTLHAETIGFEHPVTGKYIEVSAPLPEYFQHLLKVLRNKS